MPVSSQARFDPAGFMASGGVSAFFGQTSGCTLACGRAGHIYTDPFCTIAKLFWALSQIGTLVELLDNRHAFFARQKLENPQ
jgi:hypothetical protein